MTLKLKLHVLSWVLHAVILVIVFSIHTSLGSAFYYVVSGLFLSAVCFSYLIKKILQPLEYIGTMSTLLDENEFTLRLNEVGQNELDELIRTFNAMLARFHQERLKIGEQRGVFEQLMTESPVGVVLLDYSDKVTEVSPAAESLLRINKNQVVDKTITEISEGNADCLLGIEAGKNSLVMTGDGQKLKIGHFRLRDRGAYRSFFTINEMTGDVIAAQKEAYEKLIRYISHEVNTTIAITNSLLESSLSYSQKLDRTDRDGFEKSLSIVMSRTESLGKFMMAYADVIRLPAPVFTEFNCTTLLSNLSALFYAECTNRNINVELELEPDVVLNGDVHLLEHALTNILKNAVESIGTDGLLKIQLKKTPERTYITVVDDGAGLDAAAKTSVFTPFFTTKSTGQGVGLMIVQEIMRLHNYEYSLKNNVAHGASFTISIPDQNDVMSSEK